MNPSPVILCPKCVEHHSPNNWTTASRALAANCEECGALVGSAKHTGEAKSVPGIEVSRREWWRKLREEGQRKETKK